MLALCLAAPNLALAERLALVVGNGDYDVAPDLANPVNDAMAIADKLKSLEFKVTLLTDAGGASLWEEMDRFVQKAEGAESVVFYYAGHAFQMSGVNYLVPVNASLSSREAAKAEAWSLDGIIARLQSRSRQTLIFLDACRNDPLPASVRGSGAAADGLARVQTGVGTFVAFATEPGGVTADGVAGAKNSPFTLALLDHIGTPGKSISDLMIEVRNQVENATLRKQVPWDQSSLREQFYFVPEAEGGRQELSEADYELLAQLSPDDRKKFLDLLAQSGFDQDSLALAEAEIALAEANLVQVAADSSVVIVEEPAAEPEQPVIDETAVVAIEPAPVEEAPSDALPASLDDLAVVDGGVIIDTVEDDTVVASLEPGKEEEPIRLAALDWTTRDLGSGADIGVARMRLTGKLISADTPEGRALLEAIDPSLVQDPAVAAIDDKDLARIVQAELKRVGCYQMAVDGSWGKGSRTALTSYFLAKKKVPDSLEPSAELAGLLKAEPKVVCEVRVASSAVKTGKRAKVVQKSETSSVEKASVKSKKKTGKKQETAKTRITKGTIGMSGSF